MNDTIKGPLNGPTNDEEMLRLVQSGLPPGQLRAEVTRRLVQRTEAEEPEWGALLRAAAIPRRLDEGVVGVLCGAPDDAEGNQTALGRLADSSFVLPDPEGRSYALHEEVRAVLLEDWQAPERRARYVELSQALHGHALAADQGWEALYHRFAFDPAGAFAEFERRFRDAHRFYRRAECGALLAAAEEQERELDQGQWLWLHYYRARLASVLDRWAEAEEGYRKLLAELPPSPLVEGRGEEGKLRTWTLHELGTALYCQGKWAEAAEVYQEALKGRHELGDRYGEGITLMNIGNVYYSQGRWEQAIECYQESLRIKRELGDRHGEGQTLNNLGFVYHAQGRWDQAIECYQEFLRICRELGDRDGEQKAIGNQGELYLKRGQWQEARASLDKALQIAQELGNRPDAAEWYHYLGEWHKGQGQLEEAIARYQEALRIRQELEAWPQVGKTLHALAEVYAIQGDWTKTAEMAEQAAEAWRQTAERGRISG
jgi:tetratricopeptide (TPR) repeat protein